MAKQYKVGEFAKYLGVTSGFLKHHENNQILNPHISPSNYRYYEFSQAMQALQCLRLQSIGFTGKEIASMLNCSADIDIPHKVMEKKKELQDDMKYYIELLNYLDTIKPEDQVPSKYSEDWSISSVDPFYYLENAQEGQFLPDPDGKLYEIVCNWNRFMPMTELCSYVSLNTSVSEASDGLGEPAAETSILKWANGLKLSYSTVQKLNVKINEKVQLIQPGKCLIYDYSGLRERKKGRDHIPDMLERPLQICREHNFKITGDSYTINIFKSTSVEKTYVRERVILPLA